MIEFWLNNKHIKTDVPPGMAMLDFIRYEKNLKGTKIGCREGDCGACTVLVGRLENDTVVYQSHTSCLMPVGNAAGNHIVTVEGINNEVLTPVQHAIVEEGGTQCGFCTVGFVMSMTGYCLSHKQPSITQGIAAIDGNICRCTGYKSLERATAQLTALLHEKPHSDTLNWLIAKGIVPAYFADMAGRLMAIVRHKANPAAVWRVGGGTDLYVQKHDQMVHADIDFVFSKPDLNGIKRTGSVMEIGGAATVEDLRADPEMNRLFPNLGSHLKLVSSTPIRNMATLAGNFVNASPIGDMTIFFLALDAELTLTSTGNVRKIRLRDFYLDYKKLAKTTEEEITTISFRIPEAPWVFNFEKVCKRTHLDIASANCAISIEISNELITRAHVAAGGVFAFPKYLTKTSAFLAGKLVDFSTVLRAAELLQTEIAPISDARGTADYKRMLVRQLFLAHFRILFPEKVSETELWAEVNP